MEGEQPHLGDLLAMVINHVLTGMILQVNTSSQVVFFNWRPDESVIWSYQLCDLELTVGCGLLPAKDSYYYKPSFATVTGRGARPKESPYNWVV